MKLNPAFAFYLDRLVQIVSYVAAVIIIMLSVVPGDSRPHTGAPGQGEHVIAYFLTGALFGLRSLSLRQAVKILVAFVSGAAVLEIAQVWIPARNPQFSDFVASSTGVFVGLSLGFLASPIYRRILGR